MGGRGLASVDVETRRLGYSEYGDPARVVSLVTERMQAELRPGQVQRPGSELCQNPDPKPCVHNDIFSKIYFMSNVLLETVGNEAFYQLKS